MFLRLICRPEGDDVFASPENAGFEYGRVVETLKSAGLDRFEVIDTSRMSDSERYDLYISQAVAAAGNRYRVGRVFGSNRHPGEDFGWRVPALLIFNDSQDTFPADVYPHEFKDGRLETIADFLSALSSELPR